MLDAAETAAARTRRVSSSQTISGHGKSLVATTSPAEPAPPRAFTAHPDSRDREHDEERNVPVCESSDHGRARKRERVAAPIADTAQEQRADDTEQRPYQPDDDRGVIGQDGNRERQRDRDRGVDPAVLLGVDRAQRIAPVNEVLAGLPDSNPKVAEQLDERER